MTSVMKGISKGTTNWQLCGSRKPANNVYKLVQSYIVQKDPVDSEFMYNPGDINEYTTKIISISSQ
jgi:hypothetical protein